MDFYCGRITNEQVQTITQKVVNVILVTLHSDFFIAI